MLTLVCGIVTGLVGSIVEDAAAALRLEPPHEHVALWHGISVPLGLSALGTRGGGLLFLARRRVERVQAGIQGLPSAQGGYEWPFATCCTPLTSSPA